MSILTSIQNKFLEIASFLGRGASLGTAAIGIKKLTQSASKLVFLAKNPLPKNPGWLYQTEYDVQVMNYNSLENITEKHIESMALGISLLTLGYFSYKLFASISPNSPESQKSKEKF